MQTKPPLEQTIEQFCFRHKLVAAWKLVQPVFFGGCAALAAGVAVDKLVFLRLDYALAALLLGVAGLLAVLAHYILTSRRRQHVAYLVDRSMGLKNLVASGIESAPRTDEVSGVVTARAELALATAQPRRVMPFSLAWTGRHSYLPLALLAGAFLLPPMDLMKRRQAFQQQEAEQAALKRSAVILREKMSKLKKNLQSYQSISSTQVAQDMEELHQKLAELDKKEALIKLGELEEKYRKDFGAERNFERAVRNLETAMDDEDLAPESRRLMRQLAKSLRQDDMQKAAEALRELAKQMEGDKLTDEQKLAAAKQMQKVAEQMQGPEAAKKLQELVQQMQSGQMDQQQLKQKMSEAAKGMESMANTAEQFDAMQQMKEGLDAARKEMLGDSFKNFDAKQVENYMEEEYQASLGSCPSCAGGEGQCQAHGKGSGNGTGGEGQGRGGDPPETMTATATKDVKENTKVLRGKILHQMFFYGVPEKGEALEEYRSLASAAKQEAVGSLAKTKVPREYEQMVKKYFDSLEVKENND